MSEQVRCPTWTEVCAHFGVSAADRDSVSYHGIDILRKECDGQTRRVWMKTDQVVWAEMEETIARYPRHLCKLVDPEPSEPDLYRKPGMYGKPAEPPTLKGEAGYVLWDEAAPAPTVPDVMQWAREHGIGKPADPEPPAPTDEQLIADREGMWYGGETSKYLEPAVIAWWAYWDKGVDPERYRAHVESVSGYPTPGESSTRCWQHGIQPVTGDGLCGLCVQQRTAERCPCGGLYYADHWRGCDVCQNCGEDRA